MENKINFLKELTELSLKYSIAIQAGYGNMELYVVDDRYRIHYSLSGELSVHEDYVREPPMTLEESMN